MQTLNRDVVGTVARALITLNGQTTTLEVKNALRNRGFYATQADVRDFMLDITSSDGDIQYEDTGVGYRTYSHGLSLGSTCVPPDDTTFTVSPQRTRHDATDNIPADYMVTNELGMYTMMFYHVTRSQAKAKWAKAMSDQYSNARTKKILR